MVTWPAERWIDPSILTPQGLLIRCIHNSLFNNTINPFISPPHLPQCKCPNPFLLNVKSAAGPSYLSPCPMSPWDVGSSSIHPWLSSTHVSRWPLVHYFILCWYSQRNLNKCLKSSVNDSQTIQHSPRFMLIHTVESSGNSSWQVNMSSDHHVWPLLLPWLAMTNHKTACHVSMSSSFTCIDCKSCRLRCSFTCINHESCQLEVWLYMYVVTYNDRNTHLMMLWGMDMSSNLVSPPHLHQSLLLLF